MVALLLPYYTRCFTSLKYFSQQNNLQNNIRLEKSNGEIPENILVSTIFLLLLRPRLRVHILELLYQNMMLHGANLNTSIAAWIKNPFGRTSEHNHRYNHLNVSFSLFSLNSNVFFNKKWI